MILFKGDGAPHHLLPGFSNLSSCTNTLFPNARTQHYHTALKHMIVDNFTLPQHTVPLIMLAVVIHHRNRLHRKPLKQTQTPVQTAVDKVTRTNISHLQDRGRQPASGFHFWQCFHYCHRHHNHQHHRCCVIKPFIKVLRSGVSERRGFSLNPKRKSSASLRLSSLAPSSPPSTLSLFLQSSMRSRSVRQEKWMKSYF